MIAEIEFVLSVPPDDETLMRSSDLPNFFKCSKAKYYQCDPAILSRASYTADGVTTLACCRTRAGSASRLANILIF